MESERTVKSDATRIGVYFNVIAMTPCAGKHVEIRIVIFLSVCVIPEIDRHGRDRERTDEFTLLIVYGLTLAPLNALTGSPSPMH